MTVIDHVRPRPEHASIPAQQAPTGDASAASLTSPDRLSRGGTRPSPPRPAAVAPEPESAVALSDDHDMMCGVAFPAAHLIDPSVEPASALVGRAAELATLQRLRRDPREVGEYRPATKPQDIVKPCAGA